MSLDCWTVTSNYLKKLSTKKLKDDKSEVWPVNFQFSFCIISHSTVTNPTLSSVKNKPRVMMWPESPENKPKNIYGNFLKQYLQYCGYYTECKKRLQLPQTKKSSLSTEDDKVGTETENEFEERIQPTSLIEKFPEEIFRTTQLVFSFEAGKIVSRLREPQNLYAMAQPMGKQNKALWPNELQVKFECIQHKQLPPAEPEPFYEQTGEEHIPMIRAELPRSHVVYEYITNTSSFFMSSCRASKTYKKCCMKVDALDENTLWFESRFESGNLAKAVQVGEYNYELYVHCDLYTQKHTQWYYFRVTNTRKNIPYRFTIVNFLKSDSLYNYGMKPLLYSEKAASDPLEPKGWQRIGNHIKYYRNNLRCENDEDDRIFFSLTWLVEFSYDDDTVYFAHCYPYTYTDLQNYLINCNTDPYKLKFCYQRILCKTLAGNNIYILTITNPCQNQGDGKPKKVIVMTARVHPGESNTSWIMKGFLDYITGDSPNAEILRDNFVFKVVPMLNPDGVIVGNYRCSLSGQDLNRNYKTMLKDTFPPVWNIRNMIKKLLTKREILIYCDLHGHSRKQNMFMYGCENRNKNQGKFLQERIFPLLLSKNVPDKFKFDSCKFKIQKSKEGTGRVIMWNMGIINSFTLEASFCGSTLGNKKGTHFNTEDYESMGQHFCEALLNYCEPDQNKFINLSNELKDYFSSCILSKWQQKGMCIDNITISKEDMLIFESSDAGSDTSDSDDSQTNQISKKKKNLKTKKQRDKKFKRSKSSETKTGNKQQQKKKHYMKTRSKLYNNETQVQFMPTTVKISSKPLKSHFGENTKKLTFSSKLSPSKISPSSDFSDDLTNNFNKEYSLKICENRTETLLEVYLSNLGVGKKGKKKIPETSCHFNSEQQTNHFIETSDCLESKTEID